MLADALMMGTNTAYTCPPIADLLESVGVNAMEVTEPTTTLSALLGSLGGIVVCKTHPLLWDFMLRRLF